jgi:3-hydroxyacyl-[acyl-carrier-protein] dehydratase
MVKGQFTLTRYNLRDRDPALHTTDASIVHGLRDLFATLRKGSVGARAVVRDGQPARSDEVLAERSGS